MRRHIKQVRLSHPSALDLSSLITGMSCIIHIPRSIHSPLSLRNFVPVMSIAR
jgi:hypothetical protein